MIQWKVLGSRYLKDVSSITIEVGHTIQRYQSVLISRDLFTALDLSFAAPSDGPMYSWVIVKVQGTWSKAKNHVFCTGAMDPVLSRA